MRLLQLTVSSKDKWWVFFSRCDEFEFGTELGPALENGGWSVWWVV